MSIEIEARAFPPSELPNLVQALETFVLEYKEITQEALDQLQLETLLDVVARCIELQEMVEYAGQKQFLDAKEYAYWSDRLFHLTRRFIAVMLPHLAHLNAETR